MHTLLLRLSAPLQSWGSESLYDKRETDSMPTKSGVIGMLAAALGRRRDEPTEDLAELEFGVRIDLQGKRILDFHITRMGEKLNSNLSERVYLSDAVFLVGLGHKDKKFLEKLERALLNPVFTLFLGRRSCPPTQPLVLGICEKTPYDALLEEEWLAPEWRRKDLFRFSDKVYLRIVMDGKPEEGETQAVKKDIPVSFSPFGRKYKYRYIKEVEGKTIKREEAVKLNVALAQTEHDPMIEAEW